MASPLQLSDLPSRGSILSTDLFLMRSGLTDYQVSASIVQQINIAALTPIPFGFANATDLMVINRNGSNYNIRFNQVGLMQNTKAWFYQGTAPMGWTMITGLSDNLLAIGTYKPSSGNVPAGSQGGSWQQQGVGGLNGALSIAQIPNHNHYMVGGNSQSNSSCNYLFGAKNLGGTSPQYPETACVGIVDGFGDNSTHDNYGQAATHNHGNVWRPQAAVGLLANKDF